MEISVKDKDSAFWDVINLDTNKIIKLVQWANDKTGEYKILLPDGKGGFIYQGKNPFIGQCSGNIKIIKKKVGIKDNLFRIYCSIKRSIK